MQRLSSESSSQDTKALCAVFDFSVQHLGDIRRRSGESYAQHCAEVALTLREASADQMLLRVALLHDLMVHPDAKDLLAAAPLTGAERSLLEHMNELRRLHIDSNTEDLDTVISAFMSDERLLPLRMAHRMNDVRHLDRFDEKLRKQIATESLHMYTSIAGRLGMSVWRSSMEDICFAEVNPTACRQLKQQFDRKSDIDELCVLQTKHFLQEKLLENAISSRMEHRLKSLYSTYRKMVLKKRGFDELTDRIAIRIIVESEMDCYRALAVVHAHMHPIPGKLKDYIGAPKENGYKSIHTVVYPLPGVTEQAMEIQIRTADMHQACLYGPIAHNNYKDCRYALSARPARVNLFRNLESLREEARSPRQFAEALRQYFREDHLAVFDHQNNLYHMRKPATALDFACHISADRCALLKGVLINGRRMAPDTELHDGDIVELLFGRDRRIQKDWLHGCKHAASRTVLKQLLR